MLVHAELEGRTAGPGVDGPRGLPVAYILTPARRDQLERARATPGRIEKGAPYLRAWHVRMGHSVKDPTDAELAIIAKARAAKAGK